MDRPLKGCTVLVTRPAEQAQALIGEIEKCGGQVVFAPMIAIQPRHGNQQAVDAIKQLNDYDIVIFISKNAVEHGMQMIKAAKQSIAQHAVYAVGVGTGSRLHELGAIDVHTPKGEFSSEGLLKMPGLSAHEIEGKKVLIIRGAGGRELLAQSLQHRGATVDYCEVYERVVPAARLTDVLLACKVTTPDIALITSPEALTNLAEKIDQEGLDMMYDVPLMVAGERTAHEAERLGFTMEPILVDSPGDHCIVEALILWANNEQ
ncbi:MAG: uroporphyrinogen-III synthase [Gammaproteobacteria bacterium]|nr:uroporphyrinogen-III synthase [Gammaproteobacteria bacterium]